MNKKKDTSRGHRILETLRWAWPRTGGERWVRPPFAVVLCPRRLQNALPSAASSAPAELRAVPREPAPSVRSSRSPAASGTPRWPRFSLRFWETLRHLRLLAPSLRAGSSARHHGPRTVPFRVQTSGRVSSRGLGLGPRLCLHSAPWERATISSTRRAVLVWSRPLLLGCLFSPVILCFLYFRACCHLCV